MTENSSISSALSRDTDLEYNVLGNDGSCGKHPRVGVEKMHEKLMTEVGHSDSMLCTSELKISKAWYSLVSSNRSSV